MQYPRTGGRQRYRGLSGAATLRPPQLLRGADHHDALNPPFTYLPGDRRFRLSAWGSHGDSEAVESSERGAARGPAQRLRGIAAPIHNARDAALAGTRAEFADDLLRARLLVGELSTQSAEFRTRWAAHNVRIHQTGVKHVHHPVVGDLSLTFEMMELAADPGLSLLAYTAEPGSKSEEALNLLGSWAATLDEAEAAHATALCVSSPSAVRSGWPLPRARAPSATRSSSRSTR